MWIVRNLPVWETILSCTCLPWDHVNRKDQSKYITVQLIEVNSVHVDTLIDCVDEHIIRLLRICNRKWTKISACKHSQCGVSSVPSQRRWETPFFPPAFSFFFICQRDVCTFLSKLTWVQVVESVFELALLWCEVESLAMVTVWVRPTSPQPSHGHKTPA